MTMIIIESMLMLKKDIFGDNILNYHHTQSHPQTLLMYRLVHEKIHVHNYIRRVWDETTDTVWRVIFVESPKRPSKLIFVVINFMTATSPGAWHCCTNDDVINTSARDLLCY